MKWLILACFLLCIAKAQAKEIMVFGGDSHDEFLGCLTCPDFSPKSICNEFGAYGNEFSSKGMFNEFAGFGNEFSSKSPWNEYSNSTEVPVLVDESGNFYGYFTINRFRRDAFEHVGLLNDIFKHSKGDLETVRAALCQWFK